MPSRKVDVRIGAAAVRVGELDYDVSGSRETARFSYCRSWLDNDRAFALSPDMPLQETPFFASKAGNSSALPGPVADGAPDSWGRAVIKATRGGRIASDLDYLLGADDGLRSGALRYFDGDGPDANPLAMPAAGGKASVPKLLDMQQVLLECRAFEADPVHYRETRAHLVGGELLRSSIGSLGGARPKVNAVDGDGKLWIVKLPKTGDTYGVSRAEALALGLASKVGIQASTCRVVSAGQRFPVLCVERFDRRPPQQAGQAAVRVPFISAQTFMGLKGSEPGNYVDLSERMRIHCANPRANQRQLFRRIMFGILVQNLDDHLRNHGFLSAGGGKWVMSPAFDVNPDPGGGTLKTAISEIHGNDASVANLVDAAPYFDTTEAEARALAAGIAGVVSSSWRQVGTRLGMTSQDLRAVAPAMENAETAVALAYGKSKPTFP